MSDKETVIFRTISERINVNGEVSNKETVTKLKVPREPEFIKLYLKGLLALEHIPTGLNRILYEILKRMGYDNLIVINAGVKRLFEKQLNCSVHTVNKAIHQFTKSEILIRKDTGIYLINPHIFGKGEWKNIEAIRATITYTAEGRSFHTEIIRTPDENEEAETNGNS
jgi:hypothetical protein